MERVFVTPYANISTHRPKKFTRPPRCVYLGRAAAAVVAAAVAALLAAAGAAAVVAVVAAVAAAGGVGCSSNISTHPLRDPKSAIKA